ARVAAGAGPRHGGASAELGRPAAAAARAGAPPADRPSALVVAPRGAPRGDAAAAAGLRARPGAGAAGRGDRRADPGHGRGGPGGGGSRTPRARLHRLGSGDQRDRVHRAAPGAARGDRARGGARAGPPEHARLLAPPAHLVPPPAPSGRGVAGRGAPARGAGRRGGAPLARGPGARTEDRGPYMRIGITCYPTYGGSGAVATELGIELAKRGHEVHFITYAHPFRLPHFMERVYFHEVETLRYPLFEHSSYSLALAASMHEVAVRRELDLLHVHYAIPHATSAWIAREMLPPNHRLKIVTTLHGTDITIVGQERSFWELMRFSLARSDGITAVSD